MKFKFLGAVCVLCIATAPLRAAVGTSLFSQGRARLSISGAAGSSFDHTYYVLGLGAGYFIARGLEVGLDSEAWWGNKPNIYKVSPQVRYVFLNGNGANPYVGAFYRRTFFEGFDDLNSFGGRAGLFTSVGEHGYAGAGVVYEKYQDCDEKVFNSCSSVYPEINISYGF